MCGIGMEIVHYLAAQNTGLLKGNNGNINGNLALASRRERSLSAAAKAFAAAADASLSLVFTSASVESNERCPSCRRMRKAFAPARTISIAAVYQNMRVPQGLP